MGVCFIFFSFVFLDFCSHLLVADMSGSLMFDPANAFEDHKHSDKTQDDTAQTDAGQFSLGPRAFLPF